MRMPNAARHKAHCTIQPDHAMKHTQPKSDCIRKIIADMLMQVQVLTLYPVPRSSRTAHNQLTPFDAGKRHSNTQAGPCACTRATAAHLIPPSPPPKTTYTEGNALGQICTRRQHWRPKVTISAHCTRQPPHECSCQADSCSKGDKQKSPHTHPLPQCTCKPARITLSTTQTRNEDIRNVGHGHTRITAH